MRVYMDGKRNFCSGYCIESKDKLRLVRETTSKTAADTCLDMDELRGVLP